MTTASIRSAPAGTLALLLFAVSALAVAQTQTQQVYRYVDPDGRVVYSDKPPPPDARDAQAKRIGRNTIETSNLSFPSAMAQERYPAPLYPFRSPPLAPTPPRLPTNPAIPHPA